MSLTIKEEEVVVKLQEKKSTVEKYNMQEIKTLLDDALKIILDESFGYKENYFWIDIKLALGYLAALSSAYIGYINWKIPFEKCRFQIFLGAAGYFIFTGIILFINTFYEHNILFTGNHSKGTTVKVGSELQKYDPNYKLKFKILDQEKLKPITFEYEKSVENWIDVDGKFAADLFLKDLKQLFQSQKLPVV